MHTDNVVPALKRLIKANVPFILPLWRSLNALNGKSTKKVFTDVFDEEKWGRGPSRSGPGSDLLQTQAIRTALPRLVDELKCQTLLDVPCGDFYWMRLVDISVDYIGADIVDELIAENRAKHASSRRRFEHMDLIRDELPRVDLILCRDCLVHLSDRDALRALQNVKRSQSRYLLATTFVDRKDNDDITTGEWRPLNLQLEPFRLPAPIELIDEECPYEGCGDKSLGLWRIDDIPNHWVL